MQFGFSLDRTRNDAVNPYLENHQDVCLLQDWTHPEPSSETIYFRLNLKKKLWVACWANENACFPYLMWKIHSSELLHYSKIQKTEESGSAVFIHELNCPRPPLWSSGQSSWLQIQRFRVWFPVLPDFLRSIASGKGSTQPREDNWGATWKDSSCSGLENRS
jgi:hypothetical protein